MKFASRIPHFRGVYMRDKLPRYPFLKECGIVNLDSSKNLGTHWVAYIKLNEYIEYFDSYGNLKPPIELIRYLGPDIKYNIFNIQKSNPFKCGHFCLKFLINFWNKHGNCTIKREA